MSPWLGVWDLVWHSPEAWLVTGSAMIGLTVAGAAMTVLGRSRSAEQSTQAGRMQPAVVVARTQPQPKTRRGRRRHAA